MTEVHAKVKKGDTIGDTVYSERFVLKILLKFANLDALKLEENEQSFEEELCTLWDMSAENDVVEFLLKNEFYKLIFFCIDKIENQRIIEILLGTIANTCCNQIAVDQVQENKNLSVILQYIHSDDSLVLIQVTRVVNTCLYQVEERKLKHWLDLLHDNEFHQALVYILQNSTNIILLCATVELLNSIASKCSVEECRTLFHQMFITESVVTAFNVAFFEINGQKEKLDRNELERVLLVSLQINLIFVGYEDSLHIYNSNKDDTLKMLEEISDHYCNKITLDDEIDEELSDVIDSIRIILHKLELLSSVKTFHIFTTFYQIWKLSDQNDKSAVLESNKVSNSILVNFSKFFNQYLACQSSDQIIKIKQIVTSDYDIFKK